MSSPAEDRAREKVEEHLARMATGARSFAGKAQGQAGIDLRELIDPDGDSVGSLVNVEASAGAASLALPIDLITFESWVLGHLGDRDELDLDVNTHREVWFGLGSWIGETLRNRHGGFWLLVGEDPKAWRLGFSKVLLEIAPYAFAERLLLSGQGMGRRMIGEIDRIRETHEAAAEADGGKAKDRYTPQHYARLHTVPLAQWLVFDLARLRPLWAGKPVAELRKTIAEDGRRLPPQNAPILAKVDEALAKLDNAKPAAEQLQDRGLYEAVAQIVALRRATQPMAVDLLEKIALPALHVGAPDKFPPLGDDDLANIRKGTDLFAIYVDVVPFAHPAEEGGFLGTFTHKDMSTPYPDRLNLELGKGDWVVLDPTRLRTLLAGFDPNKYLRSFELFRTYVARQPNVPRIADDAGKHLAESSARTLGELRAIVSSLAQGHALVFRLLPPPA